jgi:GTP-binding protein YchF
VQVGLIGLKNTGKTTLFNAITGAGAPTGQGGVESRRSIGKVPDPRLDWLTALHAPTRQVNAQVEWVDAPGFTPGTGPDGRREATRFLEEARKVAALAQVIRCFDGGFGSADPAGEIETLALELIVADLQIVESRLENLAKEKRRFNKVTNPLEPDLMEKLRGQLESGRPLRALELNADENKLVAGFAFLTLKPVIFVLNIAEGEAAPEEALQQARAAGGQVVVLCAKLEEELAQLSLDEAAEFLSDLGIAEPALNRMIRASFAALSLITFFTIGHDECRAWTVRRDAPAPEAAGAIHSDLQRGFIRAVVVSYDDLRVAGDMAAAKRANRVREEGKKYRVKDGDVLEIRFSV